MKKDKAARAMAHLDDALIAAAMSDADLGEERAQLLTGRRKKMKKTMFMKIGVLAAAFAIVFVGVFAVMSMMGGEGNAVIALDVNPSIELEINGDEKIEEIRALNVDAKTVIGDMELEGTDLDVAINAIIGAMLRHGYLSAEQNSILVSVDTGGKKDESALKDKISGKINALLGDSNITASVITQSFDRGKADSSAETYDVSPAKATLITKIIAAGLLDAKGVPYTYETLAQLHVNELKLMLESKGMTVGGINATGTASAGKYISAEQALAIALAQAGLEETALVHRHVEMDFEDDCRAMVYEVEFATDTTEYEYEIHATTGDVLEAEQEPREEDDRVITSPTECISRERALSIAYADAGVQADAVRRPEIELDLERDVYIYEIEFKAEGQEYEYTVNALTGAIIEREVEPID